MSSATSRRAFLSIFRPKEEAQPEAKPEEEEANLQDEPAPLPPWARRNHQVARPDLLARVLPFACMGASFCTTCIEHCPVPGALTMGGRVPLVDATRCTGCGACEQVCPSGAVQTLPRLLSSP